MDVDVVHTTIFDQDRTAASRKFIKNFDESGYFAIDYYASSYAEVTELIDKGKTLVAIVIPNDFEKKLYRRETVAIQTLFEGSDGNKSSIALGYIQGITNRYSQLIVNETKDKYGMKLPLAGSLVPEVRVWYNPEMKTQNYMGSGNYGTYTDDNNFIADVNGCSQGKRNRNTRTINCYTDKTLSAYSW